MQLDAYRMMAQISRMLLALMLSLFVGASTFILSPAGKRTVWLLQEAYIDLRCYWKYCEKGGGFSHSYIKNADNIYLYVCKAFIKEMYNNRKQTNKNIELMVVLFQFCT